MSTPSLPAGMAVGRFEIRSLLGKGGMGEVYKAWDPTLQRHVALKILPPELVDRPDRLQRFVQEARSASALSHPHIVTVHEIGEAAADGRPLHYMAMELVEGTTLREEIHTRRAPLRRLLDLLGQVADGLAKAHGAGIVHRDLKPDNIMVTADGYAKIVDFGLAKLIEPRVALTSESGVATLHKTGERDILGTIGYMSPEQVEARPVDHRSDVFSFGCMLYEAATRRRPFEGHSEIDTLHKIVHDDPPAPPRDVAPELRRIIARCLAKPPEERYQSIKDLAVDLVESINVRSSEKRRRWASLAALAAGATAVTVAIFLPREPRISPPAELAIASVAVLPLDQPGEAKDE
ncbi:MAG TPA: serine/threonine-protein kinase [Thermoanaerobaculia bacterium]|nr:serine/threonine-protein kinase [Thermoanaerobaculia bacterium]